MLLLSLAEAVATVSACWLALDLFSDPMGYPRAMWTRPIFFAACVIVSMVTMGLFSERLRDRMSGVLLRVTASVMAGGLAASLLSAFWPDLWIPRMALAGAMILSWLALLVTRLVAQRMTDEDIFKRRVLAYGTGRNAARVVQLRRRADRRGFNLIGFISIEGEKMAVPIDCVVDPRGSLINFARNHRIDEIVVAIDDRRLNVPLRELLDCRLAGIQISELASFLERETGKVYLDIISPSWMIFGGGFRRDRLSRLSERVFDLLASAIILTVSLPFVLLTALAIKLEDGFKAPVLYTQERVGLHGRVFRVMKFRSMRPDAESDGQARWAAAHDSRVTRIGSLIRKTRIDELPQLLNVLRGTMSFVGPRPERPTIVARLSETIPYYQERHAVKPGITGWAQLCYPYGASDHDALEKLQFDLFYVKNHGLIFDLLILLQTVEVILFGKGAR